MWDTPQTVADWGDLCAQGALRAPPPGDAHTNAFDTGVQEEGKEEEEKEEEEGRGTMVGEKCILSDAACKKQEM